MLIRLLTDGSEGNLLTIIDARTCRERVVRQRSLLLVIVGVNYRDGEERVFVCIASNSDREKSRSGALPLYVSCDDDGE